MRSIQMTDVTSAAVSAPCEVPEDASEAAVAAVHEVPDHFYEDAAATVEVTDADREAAAGLFARLLVAVASQRNVANEMQQIVDVFHRRTTPLAVAAFECFRLSHLPMAVKLLSDSADDLIRGNLMSMMLWYATCVYRISGLDMLAEYMAVGLPAALCKVILSRGVVTAELAFNECFESEYRRLMPPQLRGEVDVWRHVVELVVDTNSLSQIGVSRCADLLGEIIYDSIQSTPLLEVVPMFPAVVSAIMPVLRQRKRSVNTVANVSKLMPFVAVANNGGCDFSLTWALIDGGACAWCINQLKRFNHVGGRMDVVATAINMVAQICEAVDDRWFSPLSRPLFSPLPNLSPDQICDTCLTDRFPCPAWKCVVCVAGPSHPGTPTPSCLTDRFPPPPGGDADDVDLHVSTSAEADAFIQRHLVDAGAGAAVAHAMDEMAAVWMTECKHGHSHLHPCVFRMFCDASSRLGRHSADFVRHFGAAPVAYRPTAYEVLAALVVEVATRVGVQVSKPSRACLEAPCVPHIQAPQPRRLVGVYYGTVDAAAAVPECAPRVVAPGPAHLFGLFWLAGASGARHSAG